MIAPPAPADGRTAVVVVERNNAARKSSVIDAVLRDLDGSGIRVFWYKYPVVETMMALEHDFRTRFAAAHDYCQRTASPLATAVRSVCKLLVLLRRPSRIGYVFARKRIGPEHVANDLRRFVRRLGVERVFLFSHSAGGIAAALAADEPVVERLVCFGYPFRHPERPEEPSRTRHLADLRKPFLIIQGNDDAYGTYPDCLRYGLSPSVRVEPVGSDHDYDDLSPKDRLRVETRIATFLDQNASSHDRDSFMAQLINPTME